MNNKMAITTYLSTIESKYKLSKQKEWGQNHIYGEHFDGCQMGGGFGGMVEEVRGLRRTNWQSQNSHGNVKDSTGNGIAKGLICMTHGLELWGGDCLREWGMLVGEGKWGEIGTTAQHNQ